MIELPKEGGRVRRIKKDSKGRHWSGTVLHVTGGGEVCVRWDHKRSEVWFYRDEKLKEIEVVVDEGGE